jgi:hypothetical protein
MISRGCWGNEEMRKWENGEMGKWGNGEMGKWENGKMGKWEKLNQVYTNAKSDIRNHLFPFEFIFFIWVHLGSFLSTWVHFLSAKLPTVSFCPIAHEGN